jgi:hypothetical protein
VIVANATPTDDELARKPDASTLRSNGSPERVPQSRTHTARRREEQEQRISA